MIHICHKLLKLTMKTLVSYETIYLLKPDLTEDSLLKIVEQYQGILVERGAKNITIENHMMTMNNRKTKDPTLC